MNIENEYFEDASMFFQKTSLNIVEQTLKKNAVESILFFALGMERVLKGILYDLNPIYVYNDQDFKNTVSIIYKDRLEDNYRSNKEILKKPNADVLSFKLALLRAKSISKTTNENTSLLFSLSNYRDIIAHATLSNLDFNKVVKMLLRDFFPLLKEYSAELKISLNNFVGKYEKKLVSISADHQESVEDKLKLKIDSHKNQWERVRKNTSFVEKMEVKKDHILQSADTNSDAYYALTTSCPACSNDALLLIELDYDDSSWSRTPVGAFISKLKCLFCHLIIEDYDEIDHLKLNELIEQKEDLR